MTNKAVQQVFRNIADLLQLQGADGFRVRSYQRVADGLRVLTDDLSNLAARGELRQIPGVGEAIAAKIEELLETGECRFHQELLAAVPPGLVQMLEVPELGPKTAKRLYDELGLADLDALEAAAQAGRLRDLKGFGAKSEANLLANIALWRRGRERVLAATALAVAEPLLALLQAQPGVLAASLAGSLRRGQETTKDLDLLVSATDGAAAIAAFVGQPEVEEIAGQGETKASVRLRSGLNADLRVVPPGSWGAALQYFTGSKAHNIAIRSRARERGLTVNEYGVRRLDDPDGPAVAAATEDEVYAALGLSWIPPELREDRGELAAAETGELPDLLTVAQIRGDLHTHTRWSDGQQSVLAMAQAARERGYAYYAFCDHSQVLTVANGLDEARVRAQWDDIAAAQEAVPEVRLLRGIEVDILSDGALDLSLDLLHELDIVVASVHSNFNQDPAKATARLLRAIRSGVVDIIGHPTGRKLTSREGLPFDFDPVAEAAAECGVALEINASPERLDLDDVLARRARARGALLVVNTDAHQIAGLDFLRYGVAQARRAWLTASDVLNTRPSEELLAWLKD
ncbi:MAG: DNA polymerase/3'-5' exonuclease PolX [Fimbriimonadaceae bacterium]|nr:DNA polymerase/3'-5' exonuclease PolX [Fimbriimonadaceae bacterium]